MDWTLQLGALEFGILDIIILVLILISGVSGAAKGFSRSVLRILAYIVCFPCALIFTSIFSRFIDGKLGIGLFWSGMIAFAGLSVIFFILVKIIANLVGTTFDTLSLGWLDSVLGFVFCVSISILILFLLLEICSLQSFVDFTPLKTNSMIYMRIYISIFPKAADALKGAVSVLG